jgi:carboxy-terminal domain RNA polymerase II polypeptide A small phosphatase
MKDVCIIDNSPNSYMLQPECGIPILSWYDDMKDRALLDYIPFLTEMSKVPDVREAI